MAPPTGAGRPPPPDKPLMNFYNRECVAFSLVECIHDVKRL